MTLYTVAEVYRELRSNGLTVQEARKMTAIALRETGGVLDTNKRNNNPPVEDSMGLYQINMLAHSDRTTVACVTDLACSTKFAVNLFRSSGYVPWKNTSDEPGLQPYYARFDKEIEVSTFDPGGVVTPGRGTQAAVEADLAKVLKDSLVLMVIIFIATMLVGIGAYGLLKGGVGTGTAVKAALFAGKKALTKGLF